MLNRSLSPWSFRLTAALLSAAVTASVRASVLDDIGITGLRAIQPSLTGTGVTVAQPEADIATNAFEVNPTAASNVGAAYNYINAAGQVATGFTNGVGVESSHADSVGFDFYGTTAGPAPGVATVVNYDANYFVGNVIFSLTPMASKIANQSFVFDTIPDADAAVVMQLYDNYVATYSTIIVTAVGNSSNLIQLPAGAYNVISVAAIGGATGNGPTTDGRSKPDIAAPGSATSFATPLVSGVATVLYQAAARGDGGAGTSGTAVDSMVIKALMLNGATKTPGWFHTTTAPLYTVTGAGEVNALTAYQNLTAGTRGPTLNELVALNGVHNAVSTGTAVGSAGWVRRANINSDDTHDGVDHFLIDLSGGGSLFTLNATLTWDREYNDAIAQNVPNATVSVINNLDFYLYNALTNTLVASSISNVDNVEQLASIVLPAGKYDLQVLKRGGTVGSANVTNNTASYFTETYGMAWSAAPVNTAGTTITSPNSFLEFSQSRSVSGVANINSVQIDPLANVSLNIMSAGSIINNGTMTFTNTDAQSVPGNISGSGGITQSGSGTTTLSGTNTFTSTVTVGAGKLVIANNAALPANSIVNLTAGKMSLTAGMNAIKLSSLTIAGTPTAPAATLDIKDAGLVISYDTTPNGKTLTSTTYKQVIAARGTQDGNGISLYNGNGITSSTAPAANQAAGSEKFTLGVINNADLAAVGINSPYTTFQGQTGVAVNSVLVRYTYAGDINLDGKINIDDYNYIDDGFEGALPGFFGQIIGDFNNDGVVNIDDYNVIDAGFETQGPPLDSGDLLALPDGASTFGSGALGAGISAVPEPASLMLLAPAVLALAARRRKSR